MGAETLTTERWAPAWWGVFLIGLVLWVAAIAVGWLTHNVIVLPTIVLLGSFLVPVVGYVAVSIIGVIPFVWLWLRADGGGVLSRRRSAAR